MFVAVIASLSCTVTDVVDVRLSHGTERGIGRGNLADAQSTLVVDDDGQGTATDCSVGTSAFSSIQAAVNGAAPGDAIFICPGTYDEQVTVTTSDLTIIGSGASLTILRPSAVTATTDLNEGVPMRPILLVDHATGVTVSDLKIDGSLADGGVPATGFCDFLSFGTYLGIYYRNSSGNVEATHVTNIRSATVCSRGFESESNSTGVSNVVLNGNLFDNYGQAGIFCVRPNTNCTVTGNTVRGRGRIDDEVQGGIMVRTEAAARLFGNVIADHYYTPRRVPGPFGGVAAISIGVLLVAANPSTHPHILQNNIFANNELNVQRID
jgi:hypothetical protein